MADFADNLATGVTSAAEPVRNTSSALPSSGMLARSTTLDEAAVIPADINRFTPQASRIVATRTHNGTRFSRARLDETRAVRRPVLKWKKRAPVAEATE